MAFINRHKELAFFENMWQESSAQLLILYGRRRVGKTELLRAFSHGKRQVFFVATQTSIGLQLRTFARSVQDGLLDEAAGVHFDSWTGAFEFLAARAKSERSLVVIDEFPYLVESDPTLLSVLQSAWDRLLKNSSIFLVLCGSSISFMQSQVLAHKSPLFGRRTGQYQLEPMHYRDAALFAPELSAADQVERFAVVGGMPAYQDQLKPGELWSQIASRILRKGSYLREEVPFLLMQELREPRLYLAILTAIAEGRARLSEIAQRALGPGESSRCSFYLQTLQDLRLVERLTPITETRPEKSRRGIYCICDPFIRFWMRYVYSEASVLESAGENAVIEEAIKPQWGDFVAPIFEDICRDFLRKPPAWLALPWRPSVVGSWWTSKAEIDVVACDRERKHLLCGECKWSVNKVGTNILERLQERAQTLADEVEADSLTLCLFARSGFTKALVERAQKENVLLFTVKDLYR